MQSKVEITKLYADVKEYGKNNLKDSDEASAKGIAFWTTDANRGQRQSTTKCFNCGKAGHIARACRSACSICQSTKHKKWECPNKKPGGGGGNKSGSGGSDGSNRKRRKSGEAAYRAVEDPDQLKKMCSDRTREIKGLHSKVEAMRTAAAEAGVDIGFMAVEDDHECEHIVLTYNPDEDNDSSGEESDCEPQGTDSSSVASVGTDAAMAADEETVFQFDTGASSHFVRGSTRITDSRESEGQVHIANGTQVALEAEGVYTGEHSGGGGMSFRVKKSGLFSRNLFSGKKAVQSGYRVSLDDDDGESFLQHKKTGKILPLISTQHGWELRFLPGSDGQMDESAMGATEDALMRALQGRQTKGSSAPAARVEPVPMQVDTSAIKGVPQAAVSEGSVEANTHVPDVSGSGDKTKRSTKAVRAKRLTKRELKLVHRRMGHVKDRRLRQTKELDRVVGLHFDGSCDRRDCDPCMRKDATKASFQKQASTRAEIVGVRIHSDVKDYPVDSIGKCKHAVCFVDDASRRGKAYPIRTKDQVPSMFARFINEECTPRGIVVKILRSDNGGEYIGSEMAAVCLTHYESTPGGCAIQQEFSSPMCQSGNGVAEVYWRETTKIVRAVLWDQQREHRYWAAALHFADTIRNHVYTGSVKDGPPEAAWTGKHVNVAHFRVPLSTCWSFIEKENRKGTLGDRRMKCVFIGYARQSRSYLVFNPVTGTTYSRRYADVVFDERMVAPEDGRTMLDDTRSTSAEAKHQGGAPKLMIEPEGLIVHGKDTFMTLAKPRTVNAVAQLFRVSGKTYLEYLQQYDGWYQNITSTTQTIHKGADVPVYRRTGEATCNASSRNTIGAEGGSASGSVDSSNSNSNSSSSSSSSSGDDSRNSSSGGMAADSGMIHGNGRCRSRVCCRGDASIGRVDCQHDSTSQ
jgi:hypothetical protein